MNTQTLPALAFSPDQNAFVYEAHGEPVSLFYPVEFYYPDAEEGQPPTVEEVSKAKFGSQDERAQAVEVFEQASAAHYFNTVRFLLSDLADGIPADDVFEDNLPANEAGMDDNVPWQNYPAAFKDATTLLALLDQIDLPRMAAGGGFEVFRRTATPEQRTAFDAYTQTLNG